MRRREFITLVGGTAAAWPLAARAQQPAVPVVGYISSASADEPSTYLAPFRQGLGQVGYVEGQNLAIEFRFAEHQNERLPVLVADLARRQVNVIFAAGSQEAVASRP